jgi:TolA-binding protein
MKTKLFLALLAGVLLLGACGRSAKYEPLREDKASAADTTSVVTASTKLVKTADIRFKVKDVQQTGDAIAALTAKINGMVMHHQMQANIERSEDIRISNDSVKRVSAFNTTADMTVRVPSDKLEDYMTEVAHMGMYVTMRKMDIEDRTLDYLSEKLKLKNRQELVAQQKQGKVIIKNPVNVMLLKDDMVDQQIGNMRTDAEVKYSTISLSFYQSNTIVQETIANDDPLAYQLPFFKRLAIAMNNGWALFIEVMLGLANIWVFIVLSVVLWMLYRYYKRKHPAWFASGIKS